MSNPSLFSEKGEVVASFGLLRNLSPSITGKQIKKGGEGMDLARKGRGLF